jgi:hypothetical protein
MYQNIVLHIPHGSEYIPEQVGNHQSPALCLLRTNSFHLIDYYTQPLFAPSVPKQAIKNWNSPLCYSFQNNKVVGMV